MKLKTSSHHLSYCTNIHPAETWSETLTALKTNTLTVRDNLITEGKLTKETPFAIGLRLSAKATEELLEHNNLDNFIHWLKTENAYIYTINGFPYGAFHNTRVKENVYKPDWTSNARLTYTNNLFNIIAELAPAESGGSVSSLPGSFKDFHANEALIFRNLYACAEHIELLSEQYEKDLHLGLEPEPLGHFENTQETLDFFQRFHDWAKSQNLDSNLIHTRIGLNYDTCHFALQYENPQESLDLFHKNNIRISKIHLSNALSINPQNPKAIEAIQPFNEPTYLHQVITKNDEGKIQRYTDLPNFLDEVKKHSQITNHESQIEGEARIHFHIPLHAEPAPPLASTKDHAQQTLTYLKNHPLTCNHLEMETYTWGVLPKQLQQPITDQLTQEYLWTLAQ